MKITKIGHCCLVIETKGIKIITDPGMFTDKQNEVMNVDLVLITHEHGDHLHMESVKKILENNPKAKIITNGSVGKLLSNEDIPFEIVEHGQMQTVKDVLVEGYGNKHQEIYKEYGMVQNTGYFIDDYFFYPGDALFSPQKAVAILALPVPGTWANMRQVIDYAYEVKPKKCFPVHDASLKRKTFIISTFNQLLPKESIELVDIQDGEPTEL